MEEIVGNGGGGGGISHPLREREREIARGWMDHDIICSIDEVSTTEVGGQFQVLQIL